MQRWFEAAAALALVLAGPASAQGDSPFAGRWCADNGESMLIEPGNVSFNEHTVCELSVDLPESGVFAAELACANYYFNDGEQVKAFERSAVLRAELTAAGLLATLDQETPVLFKRCEQ
jgi:hypothetical protein